MVMKIKTAALPLEERHIVLWYGDDAEKGFSRLTATVADLLRQIAAIDSAASDYAVARDRYGRAAFNTIDCKNRLARERAALFDMLGVEGYPE